MNKAQEAEAAALTRSGRRASRSRRWSTSFPARIDLPNLSLICDSSASMPAGRFAEQHPAMIDRMVFFDASPAGRRADAEEPPAAPAWRSVTVKDTMGAAFWKSVPTHEQPVLLRARISTNGASAYLDVDPRRSESRCSRGENAVRPVSPTFCTPGTARSPARPALVQAPFAIIDGEWGRSDSPVRRTRYSL